MRLELMTFSLLVLHSKGKVLCHRARCTSTAMSYWSTRRISRKEYTQMKVLENPCSRGTEKKAKFIRSRRRRKQNSSSMGGLKHVASTLRPLAKGLSRALEDNPVASSLCLGCASGCVGDAMAQKAEGLAAFDWRRSLTYVAWTLFVTFVIDLYVYATLFSRWFPHEAADGSKLWRNVAAAIAADSLLLSPLFYFPCFYLFTHSLVRRESPARALRLYADEAATQLPVLWAFWVPANGFMFACVPAHLRVAYCTAAVTGYVAVLSRVTQHLIRKRKTEAGAV